MSVWKTWRQIHNWISANSPDWNLTISADHQMFTVDKDAIRADMIRGTTFNQLRTYRDGKPVPVKQPWFGTYVFNFSISSGKGDWAAARVWRQGIAFNNALIGVVSEDELSPKTLPPEQSFLSVDGDSLVVSALKKADKDSSLVLRLYEESGQHVKTVIHFLGRDQSFLLCNLLEENSGRRPEQTLDVKPYQIDTIKLTLHPQ